MSEARRLLADYPKQDGIIRALEQRPKVPIGQKSNFLSLTAAVYEPLWRKRSLSILTSGSFDTARELELMIEWTKPQAGERVLDAACSAGLYARTLLHHEAALEVHALDFSLPFLKKAQSYAEEEAVSLTLVQADVRALPYADDVFDIIVCGGSLNEFTDLPLTLAEFARVLKPGGRMWQMYVVKARGLGKLLQSLIRLSGIRFIEADALEHQAQEAGFRLERAQYRGPIALALFRRG